MNAAISSSEKKRRGENGLEPPPIPYEEMQELLMRELRLYHYPIAVRFFYDQQEIERFKESSQEIESPLKPITFCQWEIAARMQGRIIYGEQRDLSCKHARYSFGWKELDELEIQSQARYTRDLGQSERFIRSKERLPGGLLGVAVAPLAKAECFGGPDTVHFYCDPMQAYHLAVDYMAATDTHPLRPALMVNSAACAGNVWTYQTGSFNMLPACSGSYSAGKTERSELNVMIPGADIGAVCLRLMERIETHGSSSLVRPGDGFPGADICKNCPLIGFKKLSA
ncbi:MAG: DUF169 domain-containing protein [Acidobacteriaceae bacterium]